MTPGPGAGRFPSGGVVFTVDGQALGPVPLHRIGGRSVAVLATTAPGAGIHTVSAAYRGDATFAASASGPITLLVKPPAVSPTTTVVAVQPVPARAGMPVIFGAAVLPPAGVSGVPTGSVTFTVDGLLENLTPLVSANGIALAALTLPGLPLGYHTVSASYSGDATFAASASGLTTFLVQSLNVVPTTTTLVAAPNPVAPGKPVSLTATITAPNSTLLSPTGSVVFTIDGAAGPAVPVQTSASGAVVAVLTTSTLPVGLHTVLATYTGDPRFSGSASVPLTLVVGSAATHSVRLTLTAARAAGGPFTFTAVATPQAGTVTPTGNMTFLIDGRSTPPIALTPTGSGGSSVARFTIALPAGLHRIAASYAGNAVYLPASTLNTPLTIVVSRAR